VAIWVADFMSMFTKLPPWQLAQVPAAIPAWPYVAGTGSQALVEVWHESHAAVVVMCPVAGFPVADVPLWQVAQLPAAIPVWLKVAGFHAVVR